MWADTKMFAGHPRGWKKVAVVSVADWPENSIKAFGWYMPGKVRIFDTDDMDDGLARLTGGGSDRDDD